MVDCFLGALVKTLSSASFWFLHCLGTIRRLKRSFWLKVPMIGIQEMIGPLLLGGHVVSVCQETGPENKGIGIVDNMMGGRRCSDVHLPRRSFELTKLTFHNKPPCRDKITKLPLQGINSPPLKCSSLQG